MNRPSHPFLALILGLMLALTGQSMAVTKAASAATGQMVLCIGTGAVTVYYDADGKPTSAPHICPDCAFAGLVAVVVDGPTVHSPVCFAGLSHPDAPVSVKSILDVAPYRSRAPPAAV